MHYLSVVDFAFPDKPSGSARVAWDIAKLVVARGHRVTLLSYATADRTSASVEDGIRIERLSMPALSTWNPFRYHLVMRAAARRVAEIDASQPVDFAHLHTQVLGAGVVAALGRRTRKMATVHSPITLEQAVNDRGRDPVTRIKLALATALLLRIERRLLTRVERIHTLSTFTRDCLRNLHGAFVAPRTRIVPHWVSLPQRAPSRLEARRALGWPQTSPILYTLRNLRPRYGIDIAIRAAAPLLEPHDAYFFIGGDGPLRASLEALIDELGVSHRIRLMGRLSDEQVDCAYAAADAFVLPTVSLECFGLIVLEALAYGCPLISTDAAALEETVGRVLPGSVVPAGDMTALRSRLESILAGTAQLPDSAELRRRVDAAYGEAGITPKILDLLGLAA